MHKLLDGRSRAWPIVAQGVVAVTGLIFMTVAARVLEPVSFGVYFTTLTCASILGISLDSCVAQAILTKSPGYEQSWRVWRYTAVMTALGGSVLSASVASAILGFSELSAVCWILALSIPISVGGMVPRARLLIFERVRVVAMVDAVSAVVANGIALILVIITTSITAAAMSSVIVAALRLVLLERAAKSTPTKVTISKARFTVAGWVSYWSEMSGTYQSQWVSFMARTADNLIVALLLGPVSLAQYSRAFSFVLGPTQQAQMALTPTAIRDMSVSASGKNYPQQVTHVANRLIILLLPIVVVISLMGPSLVPFVLGPGWNQAGDLMVLSLGLACSSLLATPARWVLLATRQNRLLRIDSYMQLVSLAGVALGAVFGGIFSAMAINSLIIAPISTLVLWRLTGRELHAAFIMRILPLTVFLFSFSAVGVCALKYFVSGDVWLIASTLTFALLVTGVAGGLHYVKNAGQKSV